MSKKPQRRSLKRRIAVWGIRVVYTIGLMAVVDCWAGHYFGHGIFSIGTAVMRDGGTTKSVGLGYSMLFWRSMSGDAYGPEVRFWLAPFVIDAAHGGIQVRWVWYGFGF